MTNAKTIKKRLMKVRDNNFWGYRAYCTVVVPKTLLQDIPIKVDVPPEWFPGDIFSFGNNPNIDEATAVLDISSVYGNKVPKDALPGTITETSHGFEWWEAKLRKFSSDGISPPEITPIDAPWIRDYIKSEKARLKISEDFNHPVLEALGYVSNWAKSRTDEIVGENLTITFGIKWRYARRKYRFCAELARVARLANKLGVPINIRYGNREI